MLNEDKIKLMTSISMFEKKEGKRVFPMSRYFKGDYVSSHMVRSFVGYTFCWMLGTVVWALYNVEILFSPEVLDNMWGTLILYGTLYGGGLILYLMITYVVYSRRYKHSSIGMKAYVTGLRRLAKRYEYQGKNRDMTREGGRT